MKKTLIALSAILFACNFANAQTQKGTQTVGLYLGASRFKVDSSTPNTAGATVNNSSGLSRSLFIGPSYSYFIANGLEIGAAVGYNDYRYTSAYVDLSAGTGSNFDQRGHSFNAQLYLRKYFLCDERFGFRLAPYAGYSTGRFSSVSSTVTTPDYANDATTHSYNTGADLDMVFYPSKKIGLTATLGNLAYAYSKQTGSNDSKTTANDLKLNLINSSLNVSVFYIFGSK